MQKYDVPEFFVREIYRPRAGFRAGRLKLSARDMMGIPIKCRKKKG